MAKKSFFDRIADQIEMQGERLKQVISIFWGYELSLRKTP